MNHNRSPRLALALLLSLLLFTGGPVAAPDFSREVIYFILIDRFSDGDQSNNGPKETFSPDRSAWKLYWGGDFQGIINHLPYIKKLGATALWITPVVKNTEDVYHYGKDVLAAYHGYWGADFKRINEHFGSLSDFDRLIGECHRMGIKLILDIVLNHTSPIGQGCDGALYDDGVLVATYSKDTEGIFHHKGSVDFSRYIPHEWENGNLFDLADLAQENPFVDRYLREATKFWLKRGIDGLRIDTARYLQPSWLASFARDIWKEKEDLWIFAEWSEGGADVPGARAFVKQTGLPLIDFRLQSVLSDVFNKKGSFKRLADLLSMDRHLGDPYSVITFVDNHDMPRFLSTAIASGASDDEARKRLDLAVALIMTMRGIPCIYYGTEQYLHNDTRSEWGIGAEPYNRQIMEKFDTNARLFKKISRLAALRKNNPALGRGKQIIRHITDDVYAFERLLKGNVVFVAINKGRTGAFFKIKVSLPDGEYMKYSPDAKYARILGPGIRVRNSQARVFLGSCEAGVWSYRVSESGR